jgi:putative tributyrin esterase
MAFLQVQFQSQALNLSCTANVILPQSATKAQQRKIPVLYLLHGYSDDHSIWMRRTAIERHVESLAPEMAVIMPAVDHSFYTDMKCGNRYWTYISEELPAVMSSLFPLSGKREDTFVAGLSMGGYGALKMALNHPNRFLACASFSGACEMGQRLTGLNMDDAFNREIISTFGSESDFKGSENDLCYQAGQLAKGAVIPEIYLACGTKDFLYENNLGFLDHLKKLSLPVKWEATPGREHTWDYWDEQIQISLKWFMELRKAAKAK